MPEKKGVLHVNVYEGLPSGDLSNMMLLMCQFRQEGLINPNSPDNRAYILVDPRVVARHTLLKEFFKIVQKNGGYKLLKLTDSLHEVIIDFLEKGLAKILTEEEYWKLHRAGVPNNKTNNSSSK